MPKFETYITRKIQCDYCFVIEADNSEQAMDILEVKNEAGDLEFETKNCVYEELLDEYILPEIIEIKESA